MKIERKGNSVCEEDMRGNKRKKKNKLIDPSPKSRGAKVCSQSTAIGASGLLYLRKFITRRGKSATETRGSPRDEGRNSTGVSRGVPTAKTGRSGKEETRATENEARRDTS